MIETLALVAIFLSTCFAYSINRPESLDGLQPNTSCCYMLSASLGSRISYSTDLAYNDSLTSYWSDRVTDVKPNCIFRPTFDTDVSNAVKLLASNKHCQFAIRGGGHLGWPEAANIEDGITFDLSSLDSISVSKDETITTVGGGAYWNQVYSYLDNMNLNCAGGRYATVGVGGLTLGGGISFFSPRVGWVADTVESFDVVLGNGKLERGVASTKYPDLFRALKGGSNNFGIVTSLKLKTWSGGPFLTRTVEYDMSHTRELSKAFLKTVGTKKEDWDTYAAFLQQYYFIKDASTNGSTSTRIDNILAYTKPFPADNSTPTFLQPLQNAAPSKGSDLGVQHLSTFLKKFEDDDPTKPRQVLSNLSFRQDESDFMQKLIKVFQNTTKLLFETMENMYLVLVFQPIHPVFTSKRDNVLGFGRDEDEVPLVNLCIQTS
ncbi:FAD-dependent monooxygenase CTB5 [Pseudocercospora fuligena]|uniref:FAD-dependent monooxygenase CTB5 n=1 Tax=Pseudocercospora fuligena TaxID=685502 RepID=A0A8H6RKN2_9PEZI|nr:FAD-dependent monooxygenase CTB5 [Pseudocercospora fuligena]